jgi:hypothetical protein
MRRLLAGTAACASIALTLALPAAAADLGPAIGTQAPAFSLTDQKGSEPALGSLLGRGVLAVVFFRSADW